VATDGYELALIGRLAHELQLSPRRLRLQQLDGVERLAALVEPSKRYPYGLVCYHITGYSPTGGGQEQVLGGEALLADLLRLAEELSESAQILADGLGEPIWGVQDLADRFGVSAKTVSRWRRRGLVVWRVVVDGKGSRLGFGERAVRRFICRHAVMVRRGRAFKHLSEGEKGRIIGLARQVAGEAGGGGLYRVARQVARRTGRAIETVRYTLRRYDEEHPEEAIFNGSHRPAPPGEHELIYQAYGQGVSVAELASQFGRAKSTIYRMLAEVRAKQLLERRIDWMYSQEFELPGADGWILGVGEDQQSRRSGRSPSVPRDVPAWLEHLYRTPLLSRGQEWDLFRCYNYLKYKAARLREQIDPARVRVRQLEEVERLLERADRVKDHLVRSNLRLVVSVAKRHMGGRVGVGELISDGNMTLMRAVEKFDYMRGAKFGTYATWSIMKNYARTIPEEQYRRDRFQTGREELLEVLEDRLVEGDTDQGGAAESVQRLLGLLTARERLIVMRHYGLNEEGRKQTLAQIGKLLGVSKERVRQLEQRALTKLRAAVEDGGLLGIEGVV